MVQAVLDDYRRAPVDAAFVALLALVEKAAARAATVTARDVAAARAAGWSEEAIYDALTVCALFNFYTTWVDGTGVPGLPDYHPSGERLASEGYVPQPPSSTDGA
jgi:hypothetical protein